VKDVTDKVEDGIVLGGVTGEVREAAAVLGLIILRLTVDIGNDVDVTPAADKLLEHETATSSLCSQL